MKVILREYFFTKIEISSVGKHHHTMAFFLNRSDAPAHTQSDLLQRVKGYTASLVNRNMLTPVVEMGDTIIVHLHPDYEAMLSVYEKDGFSCGINYRFKVTRLFPWNHPADADAREAWVIYTRKKEQDFANQYFESKYLPPPPKLSRSTNVLTTSTMVRVASSSTLPDPLIL